MNIKIVNIEKELINEIDDNCKYIIILNNENTLDNISNYKIKPILVLYNGAYVVDLENNNVIIEKSIDLISYSKIIRYANTHDVKINLFKKNNLVYQIKLSTNNYHRRLIIPSYFKDLVPEIRCINSNKEILIVNNNVSLYEAIEMVLDYLNIEFNLFELENIVSNINEKYFNNNNYWKENILYEI